MTSDALATDKLYTVQEVASHLRCTRRTIFNMIRRGELSAVRVGGLTRISASQLDAYLTRPSKPRRGRRGTKSRKTIN